MRGLVLEARRNPGADYVLSRWEKETGKAIVGISISLYPGLSVKPWPDRQPGPKEVVIEVQACGVCGSDMRFYETDKDGNILEPVLT